MFLPHIIWKLPSKSSKTFIWFNISYVIRMCAHVLFTITRMSSFLCQSFVIVCYLYVTGMYLHVIRMSIVCTRISSVCHSHELVCHPYVTRMYSVCHPYATRIYSCVIRISLVLLVCYAHVTRMWFYHEPNAARMLKLTDFQINTPYLDKILTVNGIL